MSPRRPLPERPGRGWPRWGSGAPGSLSPSARPLEGRRADCSKGDRGQRSAAAISSSRRPHPPEAPRPFGGSRGVRSSEGVAPTTATHCA
eukprot:13547078-Alexandrium_andersonii.AAC.1